MSSWQDSDASSGSWEPRSESLRRFRRQLGWVPAYLRREDVIPCLPDLRGWAEEHIYLELATRQVTGIDPRLARLDPSQELRPGVQKRVEKRLSLLREQLTPEEADAQLIVDGLRLPSWHDPPASYLLCGLEEYLATSQYLEISTYDALWGTLVDIRASSRARNAGAPVNAALTIVTAWEDISPTVAGVKSFLDRHLYAADELISLAAHLDSPEATPKRHRRRRERPIERRPPARPSPLAAP